MKSSGDALSSVAHIGRAYKIDFPPLLPALKANASLQRRKYTTDHILNIYVHYCNCFGAQFLMFTFDYKPGLLTAVVL